MKTRQLEATPPTPTKPISVRARMVASGVLQTGFAYVFLHGSGFATGERSDELINEFFFALVPSIAFLFLLPVLIRGSRPQRFLAGILSVFPGTMALLGWAKIIVDRLLN